MPRVNVWSSCNRVLDEKWHENQREAHRVRLEMIHGTSSQLSPSRPPVQLPRAATKSSFKALPKSKSPAAKARQAEIERENLKLIKKIVELQSSGSTGTCTGKSKTKSSSTATNSSASKRRTRPSSATSVRSGSSAGRSVSWQDERLPGNASYVPNVLHGMAPGGSLGVPTANAHALYTRQSATMSHHFPDQNDVALHFVPAGMAVAATATGHPTRQRTQVQIHNENKKLLQRILSSKTTFSRATWQADERERRKLLANISRFSHLSGNLTKRHSSPSHGHTTSQSGAAGYSSSYSSSSSSVSRPSRVRQAIDRASSGGLEASARALHALAFEEEDDEGGDRGGGGGGGMLTGSEVIRTGSPVTHLRQKTRVRPQSAAAQSTSSTVAPRASSKSYFRMANGEYVEVPRAAANYSTSSRSAPSTRRTRDQDDGEQEDQDDDEDEDDHTTSRAFGGLAIRSSGDHGDDHGGDEENEEEDDQEDDQEEDQAEELR